MTTATNTPNKLVLIPETEPEQGPAGVRVREETLYWFHYGFGIEGPYGEAIMHQVRKDLPKQYAREGVWWERVRTVETRIEEKVVFE